jgi:hypothetical protein
LARSVRAAREERQRQAHSTDQIMPSAAQGSDLPYKLDEDAVWVTGPKPSYESSETHAPKRDASSAPPASPTEAPGPPPNNSLPPPPDY